LVTRRERVKATVPQGIATSDTYDKIYPSVAAAAGKIVIGYYTRAYSPIPTSGDLKCARQLLDSVTHAAVPYPGPNSLQPVCLDYASRSSVNGFATETRLSAQ